MLSVSIIELPWREPADVLSGFAEAPYAVGLMSGGTGARARWSYVARDPVATMALRGDGDAEPLAAVRRLLGPTAATLDGAPPFQGGVIGMACYELGSRFEPLKLARKAGWPDLTAGLYLAYLAFDHERRVVLAVGRGEGESGATAAAERAAVWLQARGGASPPARSSRPISPGAGAGGWTGGAGPTIWCWPCWRKARRRSRPTCG
jgi:para-aminobenzoate synthetase component 1